MSLIHRSVRRRRSKGRAYSRFEAAQARMDSAKIHRRRYTVKDVVLGKESSKMAVPESQERRDEQEQQKWHERTRFQVVERQAALLSRVAYHAAMHTICER
jgi:hypothetical protein